MGQFLLADGEGRGRLAAGLRRGARRLHARSGRPEEGRDPGRVQHADLELHRHDGFRRPDQPGQGGARKISRHPRPDRGAIRRRPLHGRRDLGDRDRSTGRCSSNPKLVKDTIRSLATLAYSGGRLGKFGRQQLVAALRILQRGDVSIKRHDRLLGGRHGPDPVHPDDLQRLSRSISTATATATSGPRRRTRWPRPPTIIREVGLADRRDLGLRGGRCPRIFNSSARPAPTRSANGTSSASTGPAARPIRGRPTRRACSCPPARGGPASWSSAISG